MLIQSNGITIEVETHGARTAVPLILIRGLGSQLIHWPLALIDGFVAAGFWVITFDNRDIGLSQRCPRDGVPCAAEDILRQIAAGVPVPAAYSVADMADDVVGVMDALGIRRAHCFGISMGGVIVQTLLVAQPDRLLSATIVMSYCRPKERAAKAPSLLVYPQTLAQYQDDHVRGFATFGSPGYPMSETDLRAEAATAYRRGADAEGVNRQALALHHAPDQCAALRRVARPCLVLHGLEDFLIPPALGAEIAAHIPDSEYHEIAGMGHVITPLLAPLITDLVVDFIARRVGPVAAPPAATK